MYHESEKEFSPSRSTHQRSELVLITREQWFAWPCLRDTNELTLAHIVPRGDGELDGVGEVTVSTVGVADLQGRVGTDVLIVDAVDDEGLVRLVRVDLARTSKDIAGVDRLGHRVGALVVGEVNDVDLRASRNRRWMGTSGVSSSCRHKHGRHSCYEE